MFSEFEITTFIAALFSMMNPLGNVGVFGRIQSRAGEDHIDSALSNRPANQNPFRSRRLVSCLAVMAGLALLTQAAASAEVASQLTNAIEAADAPDTLGGSSSVSAQLKSDEQAKIPTIRLTPIEKYNSWRRNTHADLKQSIGLTLGGDYNALVQGAHHNHKERNRL